MHPEPLPCCPAHPDAPAVWHCAECARGLCPACAASSKAGSGAVILCTHCGGVVAPILATRSLAQPFRAGLPGALRAVLRPGALALLLIVSAAVQFLMSWGPKGWLLGRAVQWGWFFILVRRAGLGHAPFGRPTYAQLFGAWTGPFLRALVSSALVVLPAVALVGAGSWSTRPLSPWPWMVFGAAIYLVPVAIVASAIEGSGSRWFNPLEVRETAKEIGPELGAIRMFFAGYAVLELLSSFQTRLSIDDGRLVSSMVLASGLRVASMLPLMLLACATGHLLRTYEAELGHGDPATHVVPLFPDAKPTGTWVPPPPAANDSERAHKFEPIELEDPVSELVAAIESNRVEQALMRYAAGDVPPQALTGAQHLKVAQFFSGSGEPARAAAVLRALIMRSPRDPVAPKAMVVLARLCGERLGEAEEAAALFRRVVDQYPDSEAATFARARLGT